MYGFDCASSATKDFSRYFAILTTLHMPEEGQNDEQDLDELAASHIAHMRQWDTPPELCSGGGYMHLEKLRARSGTTSKCKSDAAGIFPQAVFFDWFAAWPRVKLLFERDDVQAMLEASVAHSKHWLGDDKDYYYKQYDRSEKWPWYQTSHSRFGNGEQDALIGELLPVELVRLLCQRRADAAAAAVSALPPGADVAEREELIYDFEEGQWQDTSFSDEIHHFYSQWLIANHDDARVLYMPRCSNGSLVLAFKLATLLAPPGSELNIKCGGFNDNDEVSYSLVHDTTHNVIYDLFWCFIPSESPAGALAAVDSSGGQQDPQLDTTQLCPYICDPGWDSLLMDLRMHLRFRVGLPADVFQVLHGFVVTAPLLPEQADGMLGLDMLGWSYGDAVSNANNPAPYPVGLSTADWARAAAAVGSALVSEQTQACLTEVLATYESPDDDGGGWLAGTVGAGAAKEGGCKSGSGHGSGSKKKNSKKKKKQKK
jgi:hypothetical protein